MTGSTPHLDAVVQLQIAGTLLGERVLAALVDRGFTDLRISDGYWFQHLVTGPRPITDLAQRMGITQQGASKAITDLERRGYVRRDAAAEDKRARVVSLTERGQAAITAGREVRRAEQARLRRRLGPEAYHAFTDALAVVLSSLDGPAVIAGRAVPLPG
jgi:DNA-binding MarR family transcriptional regulator